MKNDAIVCNIGHFDCEIQVSFSSYILLWMGGLCLYALPYIYESFHTYEYTNLVNTLFLILLHTSPGQVAGRELQAQDQHQASGWQVSKAISCVLFVCEFNFSGWIRVIDIKFKSYRHKKDKYRKKQRSSLLLGDRIASIPCRASYFSLGPVFRIRISFMRIRIQHP